MVSDFYQFNKSLLNPLYEEWNGLHPIQLDDSWDLEGIYGIRGCI